MAKFDWMGRAVFAAWIAGMSEKKRGSVWENEKNGDKRRCREIRQREKCTRSRD